MRVCDIRRTRQRAGVLMQFIDRHDAGRRLAATLEHLRGTGVVVLGLPRGGVPVAAAVADALQAELDVIVVRKLGVPSNPELAMGAVGESGVVVVNRDAVARAGVSAAELALVEGEERRELARRVSRYRRGRGVPDLRGRPVVIVDDGMATGATARAACQVAGALGAARVVLAVPVAPGDTVGELEKVADEVVVLHRPADFLAVAQFYQDFLPTSDHEVRSLLVAAADRLRAGSRASVRARDRDVRIPTERGELPGRLVVPAGARAVVVFAHGSASSRNSPRNRLVADRLVLGGLGTLLVDLLTPEESVDRANVFDVELLSRRLLTARWWLTVAEGLGEVPVGLFGSSTGAAAALWAAADPSSQIGAIVSRGGRPDLAAPRLGLVTAPTLLVVGGRDPQVLELNRRAAAMLHCENKLVVVPGATHLFEEPGALETVAELAAEWFADHLARDGVPGRAGTSHR
jgi:predicted phosphoribosyltransferase/dienelactone hydrolase